MSALIAFTGPPNVALQKRMLQRLNHRGSLGQSVCQPYGTLAVLASPEVSRGNSSPGDSSLNRQTAHCSATPADPFVISGFVFGAVPTSLVGGRLPDLRGSYAAAWFDQSGTLHARRDPVGTQSLYYGRLGNRWCVATEPKAITLEAEFRPRIRPAAIAQYLTFSFVPGSGSMLEDLYEVEAGTEVALHPDRPPAVRRYFCFEDDEPTADQAALDASDGRDDAYWIHATRQRIAQAVVERLPSGDDVAVTLSGGLDSSIIAYEVAKHFGPRTHTFSIHFGPKYPNELEYARAVAKRIGSQHHEIELKPKQFLGQLRPMIWHLDEPIGDPITQPNFEVARLIGRDFAAVFNGEGGDPLFGGPKNLTMLLHHWYHSAASLRSREQAYLASYRRAYEQWRQLLSPELRQQIDPQRDLESILTPFFAAPQPTKFLNKLMAINIRLKGANLILPKVDRMMAAHGVTPLSPLFDDQLTRLSFQMPPKVKLRGGIEKWVLKAAYRDVLPASVIDRPKSGMRVPVHNWFQGELRGFSRQLFQRLAIENAGLFDAQQVRQLMRYQSDEGPGRYGLRLWMLMTLEIWRQIFVERQPV